VSRSSLRRAYGVWAPIYDRAVSGFSGPLRRQSLTELPEDARRILIDGIGTGLDLPYLPAGREVLGIDLSRAMLRRAQGRGQAVWLVEADAEALPLADQSVDLVVLHLILAVVPDARKALAEVVRVLRPGGEIRLLDKFLRPGERAWLRRAIAPLSAALATHTDLVFEDILAQEPSLVLISDSPAALGGWFRLIRLRKTASV
jgi:phosphatidylethanolamine/phosphatidyl-N-methylethanolamine N-methyltransferase